MTGTFTRMQGHWIRYDKFSGYDRPTDWGYIWALVVVAPRDESWRIASALNRALDNAAKKDAVANQCGKIDTVTEGEITSMIVAIDYEQELKTPDPEISESWFSLFKASVRGFGVKGVRLLAPEKCEDKTRKKLLSIIYPHIFDESD